MSEKLVTFWKRTKLETEKRVIKKEPIKPAKTISPSKWARGTPSQKKSPPKPTVKRANEETARKVGKTGRVDGKKTRQKSEGQPNNKRNTSSDRVNDNFEVIEEFVPPEATDDGSWLGSYTESFVKQWGAKEQKQSMANFENDRLGEMDSPPAGVGRTKRLENTHEYEDRGYLNTENPSDSLTNSVSFQLTAISSDDNDDIETRGEASTGSLWTASMKSTYKRKDGSTNEDWDEIVMSADVVARRIQGRNVRRAPNRDSRDKEVQNAMTTIKTHANLLNMREKELYTVVCDDPCLLNGSTFDSKAESLASLDYLFKTIDDRIDDYVDAFDTVFTCVQTLNDGFSCAPMGRRKPAIDQRQHFVHVPTCNQ
jgi:hypothetical protein